MTATHRDVATGAGVRVGDTHEAVTNAYGSPSVASGEMLTYYVSGAYESEWFSFALENGRVVEITYETLLNWGGFERGRSPFVYAPNPLNLSLHH